MIFSKLFFFVGEPVEHPDAAAEDVQPRRDHAGGGRKSHFKAGKKSFVPFLLTYNTYLPT